MSLLRVPGTRVNNQLLRNHHSFIARKLLETAPLTQKTPHRDQLKDRLIGLSLANTNKIPYHEIIM